jgi:4-amino-4-deoxy-L-arabinose transferase-like glycosyltransferase
LAGCVTVVAVALALRLYGLGSQSFWIDEISVTSFVRSGHLLSDLRNRGGPFEPPLHFLAVLAAIQLPIGFETAARIPSALFGGVEALALILTARELTRRRDTALVAGALLAVAPFAVRYAQENRYYVMFSALHLLSWWLLLRALRLRRLSGWVWYGVLAGVMQLTHPFAPLVLVVQAGVVGYVAWRERKEPRARLLAKGYLTAVAIGVLLILPWYLYGAWRWIPDARAGKSYDLNPPGAIEVRFDSELFKRAAEWLLGNGSEVTLLVVLLVLGALAAPLLARGRDRWVAGGVLAYTIVVTLALVRLAMVLVTYFAFRRVELLVAPLLLLVAMTVVGGVDRLREHVDRRIALGVGGAVATLLVVLSLAATVDYYDTEKSNYRALARVVRDAPADGTVVIGPVGDEWVPLIRRYLQWKGVDRDVTFLVAEHLRHNPPPPIPFRPGGVTWLTGAPPPGDGLTTEPLNDLDRMQIIAGDRSVILAILPWFASTSTPPSAAALERQRDSLLELPPFMPAQP